jgi:hypothetical protein
MMKAGIPTISSCFFNSFLSPQQQLNNNSDDVARNDWHFQILHGVQKSHHLGPQRDFAPLMDRRVLIQVIESIFRQKSSAIQNHDRVDQQ